MKIRIYDHGSLALAKGLDDAGRQWITDTAPEDAQFTGDYMAIEPRCVAGFAQAALQAGAEIEVWS